MCLGCRQHQGRRRSDPKKCQAQNLRLGTIPLIRLAEARHLLADGLFALFEPQRQFPLDEAVEPFLVGPGAKPVRGLRPVALEIAIGETLEATPTYLSEVFDPVPLERLAPAC